MYAVILAGGVGTRLWPRSRQTSPKQFTDITGSGRTMIQQTADRVRDLIDPDRLYVVTGAQYAELAAEQLPDVPHAQIIVEPSGRNTGPAIGLACLHIRRRDPNALVATLHSDHAITDAAQFRTALRAAFSAAEQGYIVTLGIEPTFPHTGYGYIKRETQVLRDPKSGLPIFGVRQFLEKPNRSAAEAFLAEGGYYWNAGYFVSHVGRMIAEFQRQLPQVYSCLDTIGGCLDATTDPLELAKQMEQVWSAMPSISIDHGIMEGAQRVAVVPLQAGWSDIGSWDALETLLQQDETNNYVAKGQISTIDSRDNIVYSDKKMVALIGVENLVVVDTGDTLLIGHKNQMQRVKDIVDRLRAEGRSELL
jgi:mannose-1-phosphate guanylyltransferase